MRYFTIIFIAMLSLIMVSNAFSMLSSRKKVDMDATEVEDRKTLIEGQNNLLTKQDKIIEGQLQLNNTLKEVLTELKKNNNYLDRQVRQNDRLINIMQKK